MGHADDDLALDLELARRRRRKRDATRRRLILFVGLSAFVSLAVGAWVAVAVRGRTTKPGEVAAGGVRPPLVGAPSPTSEGDTWTMTELRDYLRSRGVQCRIRPGGIHGTLVLLGDPADDDDTAVAVEQAGIRSFPALYVDRDFSAEAARQRAGVEPDSSFAWGRFRFDGHRNHPEHLDRVHRALTGRPFRPSP